MAFHINQCSIRVYANGYDSQNYGILEWNEIVRYGANWVMTWIMLANYSTRLEKLGVRLI